MARRDYYKALQEELNRANSQAPTGLSREQLQARIEQITDVLRGPLSDGERIGLVADRRQYQNELARMS